MQFKNPVPKGRLPDRLMVMTINEGPKSGCVAGSWFGDILDPGHPAIYINANDRDALEEALSKLPSET